ncbi:hypothetical protein [Mycetocola sp. 2940]|uniref:hypothetical protein n=1 Tax=Mycetocola sp. 2940 TaxID=3156452 RepID=UPI003395C3FD
MSTTQDRQKQLQSLVRQLRSESEKENESAKADLAQAEEQGTPRAEAAHDQLIKLGLSEADLTQDKERAAEQQSNIEEISSQLSKDAPSRDFDPSRVDLTAGSVPEGVQVLTPAFSSVLSTPLHQTQALADAPASDWYYNNVEHNPWAWAQGAGSGIAGTGVGQTTVEVDFWYYFIPRDARFYGINPYTTYRGFYIVKSDDSWYDSHYARAVVSSHVNVYQYNWKGWNSVNELDVGNDNINVNQRFDTTRNHYYSALLGANDGAWILNRVQLWVYARGGSAYSKLDFGTGSGNYITAPYVYVS